MRHPALIAAALAAASLTGCYVESADCTPTRVIARPASKVNVGATSRSAVIEARLVVTATDKALPGKPLDFEVLDDDSAVYRTETSTGSNGTARVDLIKRADVDAVVGIVRADSFRASFDGDSTYCSSSDAAGFSAVR